MHAPVASRAICASCRHALRASFSPLSPRTRSYATAAANRHDRPLRMAVVGSGPAGFYTAYRVMSRIQGAKVDMYEALPVPYGLVRFGVAPDHPEVKNCQEKFEEVATSPDFTFIGNVSVGHPSTHQGGGSISLASVLRHYDAVVFSYGASKDRKLGVPGESLKGVYSAREFVSWYNGLPEWAGLAPDLTSGDEAVIIGQGNVALDCARMLLEDVDKLRKTDIADHAIETLSKSRIKRVHVVGRRGALQAAFTIKEARELMKLPDVGFHPVDRSLIPEDLKTLPRAPRRLMEMLVKGSAANAKVTPKSWSLDFCLSPRSFLASDSDASRVGATVFERTSLSSTFEPNAHAAGTGQTTQLPSSLVFRSIGYRSEPLQGFSELDIPFDERRGVIANDGLGRVVRETRTVAATMEQAHYPGLYCAGWVKRGPTGVIASTMEDAFTTGDVIASDWASGAAFLEKEYSGQKSGWEGVLSEGDADGARVVQWKDWQRIDQAERSRGQAQGKEREKFTTTTEMLDILS